MLGYKMKSKDTFGFDERKQLHRLVKLLHVSEDTVIGSKETSTVRQNHHEGIHTTPRLMPESLYEVFGNLQQEAKGHFCAAISQTIAHHVHTIKPR